jgi:hypothetical protein
VSDLSERLHEASIRVEQHDPSLTKREAARQERVLNTDAARLQRHHTREAIRAETARRYELGYIVNTFRSVLKDAKDPGSRGFVRDRQFRKRQFRLGRRPRGWIVGRIAIPIQLPTHVVDTECHLVLCVDGRLYAALDGIMGGQYRIGQGEPPKTTWVLSPEVWHTVEATIPETVGAMIGRLNLTWPLA